MRINKFFSVFLSLLMVCSIFGGLSVSATTIDETHTYTVVGEAAFLSDRWNPNTPADDMTRQADGTYKKTYVGVAKSDCCTLKVCQDHGWDVSFGPELDDPNPVNIEFSVPEDNSQVDIILTLEGTREKDGDTIPDGYVKVLVNGLPASGRVIPSETTYYVAGAADLCNGIAWDQKAEENKMTKRSDGCYVITFTGVNPTKDGSAYQFKVVENGAWDPAYGYDGIIAPGGENAELYVTEPNSTVKIVLTASLKVKAYVNDRLVIPGVVPVVTTTKPTRPTKPAGEHSYTVVGDADFLGAKWDPSTYADDMELQADGTYKKTYTNVAKTDCCTLKVAQDYAWDVSFGPELDVINPENIEFSVPEDNSTVDVILTLQGTREKDGVTIPDGYVKVLVNGSPAPGKVVPTSTTRPVVTTNEKGETSGVTSLGGIYTGPTTGELSRRYFFAMPKDWYTFPNATACANWWEGTDACEDWQHSYQMPSTPIETEDGTRVYYIDIPDVVDTVIFNNGINFSQDFTPNRNKSFQTVNLSINSNQENMVYVVSQRKYNFNIGVYKYSGEWYYLHADGNWDKTPGTTYEVQKPSVKLEKKAENVLVDDKVMLKATFENKAYDTIVEWKSSNENVATVDENGVVTGKNVGETTITISVKNPGATEVVSDSCVVSVDHNYKRLLVLTKPEKLTYYLGEKFDSTGLEIAAITGKSESIVLDKNDYTLDVPEELVLGKNTITVKFRDLTTTFDINVVAKDVESIKVTPPSKTVYFEGEELDTTGLEVTAYYQDGTSEKVTDYKLTGYDSTVGEKTIEVEYKGKKATFTVEVKEKEVLLITVNSFPTKTVYTEGEKINLDGLQVLAFYKDGSTSIVTDYTIGDYDSTVGEKIIDVNYKGKTAYFKVEFLKKSPVRIAVTKYPNKHTYKVGEKLDTTGLIVEAYYQDGTSEIITDYTVSYDFNKSGKSYVLINYGDLKDILVLDVVEATTKVTKVALNKNSVTLDNGKSIIVKATVSPSNASNKKLRWTSSNSKVAVVNSQGKITAKGRGTATIKVMALGGSNKYATVKVTVKQPVTSVKLNKKSVTLKVKGNAKQKKVTLKATVNPKNANVKSVKWTTSKSKIAIVNSKGKVTAKKKGTCFIYATAKDGSKKAAKCKIVVK